VSDRIPRANELFDNVVTSFGAFNEPVDVVALDEDFPKRFVANGNMARIR